jgi:kumamolisin
MTKQPVLGSEKFHPEGVKCVGQRDPREQIQVIVVLRRKDEEGFRQLMQVSRIRPAGTALAKSYAHRDET